MTRLPIKDLRARFGDQLLENEALSRYTSARVGGPAVALLTAPTAEVLADIVWFIWQHDLPYAVLGGGSNVLVSDIGFDGLVVLNRARQVRFELDDSPPSVWAESGANFGSLARQACQRGLGGLEWAVGVPGSVGGAVVGNAGAHDGDMAGVLLVAEILHRNQVEPSVTPYTMRENWSVERLHYQYRSSVLKRQPGQAVVLAAQVRLENSTAQAATAKADNFSAYRQRTQPPGATMGSMFKNPPGDHAGRLIEAAGLKGTRIGDAEISRLHANFFINHGQASATQIYQLIDLARTKVKEKFGIILDLEVELLGEWQIEGALE